MSCCKSRGIFFTDRKNIPICNDNNEDSDNDDESYKPQSDDNVDHDNFEHSNDNYESFIAGLDYVDIDETDDNECNGAEEEKDDDGANGTEEEAQGGDIEKIDEEQKKMK